MLSHLLKSFLGVTKRPQYLIKAVLDKTAYEWQQYVRFSLKFKLNIRHLFLTIPFESNTKQEPLFAAVTFLKRIFGKNKSLHDYSPNSFPKECISCKLWKYLYKTKIVQVYGKAKSERYLMLINTNFLSTDFSNKE